MVSKQVQIVMGCCYKTVTNTFMVEEEENINKAPQSIALSNMVDVSQTGIVTPVTNQLLKHRILSVKSHHKHICANVCQTTTLGKAILINVQNNFL